MRGYQQLFDLRKSGRKPTFVSVDVGSEPKWLCDHWHEQGLQAYILIEPADRIDELDLRAVFGLLVHVSGQADDVLRVQRVFEALARAGADRVIGGVHRKTPQGLETTTHFDTAGVLTWQE